MRRRAHTIEHEIRLRMTNDPIRLRTIPKRQRKPDPDPQQTDETHCHKALIHRAQYILVVHHPTVKETHTRSHQQHQCSTREHPRGITRIDLRHDIIDWIAVIFGGWNGRG